MPGRHEKDDSSHLFEKWGQEMFSTVFDEELPAHDQVEDSIDEHVVELMSLRLDVEEIKDRIEKLGIYHAAAYWHFPFGEKRLSVYLEKSEPEDGAADDHFQYLRMLVNRIASSGDNEETASIEDYYVDLDNGGIMSYRDHAHKDASGWHLAKKSPPIVRRYGVGVTFVEDEDYRPFHPLPPDNDTLLDDLKYQRRDAFLVLQSLRRLNPESEADVVMPYEK